jgi:hypothetical protein
VGAGGTAAVEAAPGHAKTPPRGSEKTVPGCLLGRSRGHWEDAETSGTENKARSAAGGQLWQVAVGLAATLALVGRPGCCELPCLASVSM